MRHEDSTLLCVDGISVRFGGVQALEEVNLSVGAGELVGVVGPNGAGKTTLFNVISGFCKPVAGRILFRGKDVCVVPAYVRAQLGIVRTFQNLGVLDALTVLETVCLALHNRIARLSGWQRLSGLFGQWEAGVPRAREILELVGLQGLEQETSINLPYGYQKRLELARALAADPAVLLLDEPVAGLSPEEKVDMVELVRKVRSLGISVLLVEHDVKFVASLADRVVVLNYGRVIAEGIPDDVLRRPEVVAAYIGAGAGPA